MLGPLMDILFPPSSLARSPGTWLTSGERSALRVYPLRFEKDALLREGMPSLDRLVAGASYGSSPLLREAIRRFKYRRIAMYSEVLGEAIAETSHFIPEWPPAVVCPVPLHWTRQFLRGFNQAAILADAVSSARGWPVRSLLIRTRATGSQARRSDVDRRTALQRAFTFHGDVVPSRVILVDDVCTTGATLEACAVALREAGVPRVDAITLAVAFA